MAESKRPSPFQALADNQQPAPSPSSPTSLPAKGQECPQRQSDSKLLSSIWPWQRLIRRPTRKSKTSLNCPQLDPQVGNKETLPAAAKNGQQPAQHPPAVESGRLSQPQKAAVEDTARPPSSPFAQRVPVDQRQPQFGHAAVEDTAQLPPSHSQRVSGDQRHLLLEHAAVGDTAQLPSLPFQHASLLLDRGLEAQRVALHRQLRKGPKKSITFALESPSYSGFPSSHAGLQVHSEVHSSQKAHPMQVEDRARSCGLPSKPMPGRVPASPFRHVDGGCHSGPLSVADAAKNVAKNARATPRLARVMSWKVTQASSLSNQGLGSAEAEASSLTRLGSSTSQLSAHCEALSSQLSLSSSFPKIGVNQGYVVIGPSQDDLINQGTSFSQGRGHRSSPGSIMGERPA
mmetsp:Transcript_20010/g.55706  ORF Transcript_20010/g.55706 Transcript_20010/m.55706 type:complete len:402 (-) Transcript_20010:91-1296(-)